MFKLMPSWFKAMVTVSIAAIAYGSWQAITAPEEIDVPEEDTRIELNATIEDYFWLDTIPNDEKTPFNAYLFKNGFGVSNKFASAFKIVTEVFKYSQTKDSISFNFLHDNRSCKSAYEISSYNNPNYPFLTLQMTIAEDPQNDEKKTTYYTGPELRLKNLRADIPENMRYQIRQLSKTLSCDRQSIDLPTDYQN